MNSIARNSTLFLNSVLPPPWAYIRRPRVSGKKWEKLRLSSFLLSTILTIAARLEWDRRFSKNSRLYSGRQCISALIMFIRFIAYPISTNGMVLYVYTMCNPIEFIPKRKNVGSKPSTSQPILAVRSWSFAMLTLKVAFSESRCSRSFN